MEALICGFLLYWSCSLEVVTASGTGTMPTFHKEETVLYSKYANILIKGRGAHPSRSWFVETKQVYNAKVQDI